MKGRTFLLILLGVTAVDVLVPYLLIGQIASFAASFLFWCIVPLATILYAAFATNNWRKSK